MSHTNWIGQTIGGRYQIEAQLGQGGMSTVYRSSDPNLQRTVAVKLIHPHLASDPDFVRRFEQEAAAVAQLRHANIIQVYDFNRDADTLYMVLEFVPGETLQSRLKALHASGERLPVLEAVRIMATICDAVAFAHQRGMIHRDLKPANVMLNPDGQPILMDFGVAKMLGGQQHTATGAVVGTATYMSPEQARGDKQDERTDLYSIGVMLFELAAGRPPFEGDSGMTVMLKHLTEPPPDVHQLASDVPADLGEAIQKALAKEPAERFQTAGEMAAALRSIAAAHSGAEKTGITPPPKSRPDGAKQSATVVGAPPARAWLSRPVVLLAGAAMAVLVLLVAGGFALAGFLAGRPSLPTAEGMVYVPAGVYLVGVDKPDAARAALQQVKLQGFWIDEREVTNAEFAEFVRATGQAPPSGWSGGAFPAGEDQWPVQGVSWNQAGAYCQWVNKRLPDEAEWEVAARGPEGNFYPWGDNETTVELPGAAPYPVGSLSANRSWFGVYDMAGNVWEWVGEPYAPVADGARVLRGGSYGFIKDMTYRLIGDPNLPTMDATAGIRCAAPVISDGAVPTGAAPFATAPLPRGVLYQDEFADPASGWPIGEEGNYTFGYHPQSFYHLQVKASNDRLVVSRDLKFNDFIAESEILVDHTATQNGDFRYGLVVRRTGEQYYAFTISARTKTWRVERHSDTGSQILDEGSEPTISGPPGLDVLRVTVNAAAFAFSINGNTVAEFTDPESGVGEVGFIVDMLDETLAHIHFGSLTLREVERVAGALVPTPTTPPPSATTVATAAAPTATPSQAATPSPTAPPGMVVIPGGTFTMGSNAGGVDERPEHAVTLKSFLLDVYEVTNERYQKCVDAGACTAPRSRSSFTRASYFGNPEFANYPVVFVSAEQAVVFCQWEGKRLPTEAEWEYAASGGDDRIYPWGNEWDPNLVPDADLVEVGSIAGNVSPFGVHDLAGNALEWVADRYGPYAAQAVENPTGPETGLTQVRRGGSFGRTNRTNYTTTRRYDDRPTISVEDVGFRCAADVP